MKVYQKIAHAILALDNCENNCNKEWATKHRATLNNIERDYLPEYKIDRGSKIEINDCRSNKIVISISHHHMDENGFWDGWTDHKITIRPDFVYGLDIKISGSNRNNIKAHLHDLFYYALTQEIVD